MFYNYNYDILYKYVKLMNVTRQSTQKFKEIILIVSSKRKKKESKKEKKKKSLELYVTMNVTHGK